MSDSAGLRELRKQETSHRISRCAQGLTDTRGLDGFTMDELAEESGVSRRTLFNYFPSKIDAVLGAASDIDAMDLETFKSGGPHGRLLDDLGVLAMALLSIKDFDRPSIEIGRRVMTTEPRLLAAAHQRFQMLTGEFATLILTREGEDFGHARARLLVQMLVALFDSTLDVYLTDPDRRELAELYRQTLSTARDLLA